MHLKRKILLLFFYVNIFSFSILLGQDYEQQYERRSDSVLLAIKYAEGNEKIELAKIYTQEYSRFKPAEVVSLIDTVMVEQGLSSLDSAHFYFYKSRALTKNKELSNKSFYLASKILDTYKGPATKQFHVLKNQQYLRIGVIDYLTSGGKNQAIPYFLKALTHAKESQDKTSLIRINAFLGVFYADQEDYTKAIEYLLNGCNLFKEYTGKIETDHQITFCYSNLANFYIKTNQLDLAKEYIEWLQLRSKSPTVIEPIATYYQKTNQDLKVIELISPKLKEIKNTTFDSFLPVLQYILGISQLKLNQYEEGEATLLEARLGGIKTQDAFISLDILNALYKYYKKRGNFEKSLIYLEEYKTLNDSTLYTEHQAYIEGIEASYELKIKEEENKVLQEKEKNKTQVIHRQRWIGLSSIGIILFLIGTTISYFRNANTKKKLNDKLRENNEELRSKNLQIKSIADELTIVTDNFPEAIGHLDENFKLIFRNEKLSKFLKISNEELSESSIFHLLEFPNHDEASIISNLRENKKLDFIWMPEYKENVYQVKFLSLGNVKDNKSYLLIIMDVTYLKQQEQEKLDDMQLLLTDLEEAKQQESIEKNILSVSLEKKKRELTSNLMLISRRNSNLENIIVSLKDIYKNSSSTNKKKIDKVISQLQINLEGDDLWKTFTTYFQEIYPSFLATLKSHESRLSNNEIRHCTFIKLGLNNREVADMLNVSSKTVEVARYRIKKKLNLDKEERLSKYITDID